MISIKNISKSFTDKKALDDISIDIGRGCIFGLVGSNGSGKSTLLRLITGVYRADGGDITIDGEPVFDNPSAKKHFVYVSDELFLPRSSSIKELAGVYAASYENFSFAKLEEYSSAFGLNIKADFSTFSKGMKRQAATVLALSCMTDYIFLDETFDGLDPVMRRLLKRILYNDVTERNITAVITSHSLRELEDTCDKLALIHGGNILFDKDISDIQTMLYKIQIAFNEEYDEDKFSGIDIKEFSKLGKVATLIIGNEDRGVKEKLLAMNPLLFEILPLTLDEVFTYEMQSRGYAFEELFSRDDT